MGTSTATLGHWAKVRGAGLKRDGEVGTIVMVKRLVDDTQQFQVAFADGYREWFAAQHLKDVTGDDMSAIAVLVARIPPA